MTENEKVEDKNVKEAQSQLAWASLRVQTPIFTYDKLREVGLKEYNDDLKDWTRVFADFIEAGYFQKNNEAYSLTPLGKEFTDKLRSDSFGDMLLALDESKAYQHLCELVYGKDLGQFSMTTVEQLDKLVAVLKLDEHSKVLDLGCGIGKITEYISDETGARVTGLDFAEPAIKRAQARTKDKADRLSFVVGTMNQLDLPTASFDAVISSDTLYFATDLQQTLSQLKSLLNPNGQMGLFWTQQVPNAEDLEQLQPSKTRLAQALTSLGLTYKTYDYTDAEKRHWQREMEVLEELKPEFEAEDNTKLFKDFVDETQGILGLANSDRISRYLYHVQI